MGGIGIGQDVPKSQKLYQNLIKDGYTTDNLGTYDDFNKALQNPISANKIYSGLRADGYTQDNLGTLPEFQNSFIQKKNPVGNGSPNTSPLFPSGLPSFPSSPPSGDPSFPMAKDGIAKQQLQNNYDQSLQQQAQQNASDQQIRNDIYNKQIKAFSGLSPQEKQDFQRAQQSVSEGQGDIADGTAQQKEYLFRQTPAGKIASSVQYLGSQATHSGLQIAKGVAHLWNVGMNSGDPIAQFATDQAFNSADKVADLGLTQGDISTIQTGKGVFNKGLSAAGMAANFAPTILGGEALQSPRALLYLQGLGQGKELADNLEKDGQKLNPLAKEALIQGSGGVNLILSDLGDSMFGSLPSALKSKVVTSIAADVVKEAAGKDITAEGFKQLLDNGAKAFSEKIQQGGLDVLKSYTDNVKTFAKLNTANFVMHKAVDAVNDTPVFNENLGNLAENLNKTVTQDAPIFSVIPAIKAITKLSPYSGYKNDVLQSLMHDPSDENISVLKQQIADHGTKAGWTPEQIQATNDHVSELAKITKALPKNLPDDKITKAVELVQGRNDLQKQLDAAKEQQKVLDPVFQGQISPSQEFLQDKVDQANDKLKDLATGTKTTYSKGREFDKEGDKWVDNEGKFFKTTDGKKEEITEGRYSLEHLEREAKKQPEQPTELPVEAPKEDAGKNTGKNDNILDVTGGDNRRSEWEKIPEVKDQLDHSEIVIKNKIGHDWQIEQAKRVVNNPLDFFKNVLYYHKNALSKNPGEEFYKEQVDKYQALVDKLQSIDDKYKEDATVAAAEPDKVVNDETTNNQITNPQINESETNKGGSEEANAEKTDAVQKEVETPGAVEATPGTTDPARQKAIDAITHGVLYSPDEKFDGYSPRFDFGMDAAEKKKAAIDISKGNYETAPAKKMISKIMEWDKNDNYPIIEGTGGHTQRRQGATAEDIQNHIDDAKANKIGELSPRQVEEHNQSAKELGFTHEDARRYEEYQQSGHGDKAGAPEVSTGHVQQPENDTKAGQTQDTGDKTAQGEPPAKVADKVKTPSLTDEETARKNELRKKFFGRLNDITNIPTLLADKEFREYAGLVFKESLGDFKAFSKELIDSVGDKIKEHLPGLFKELGGKLPDDTNTGIRNADVATERGELVERTHKTKAETDAEGKRLVDSGELDPDQFARDIIDNPKPATTEEQAALRYHKVKLNKLQRSLLKDSEENPENSADNGVKYARNEDLLEYNRQATEIIGNEAARTVGDRVGQVAEDYSRVYILRRAKMANMGEPLSPKDEAELTTRTKRIAELENKLADREDEIRKLIDKNTVSKVNRAATIEERTAKREVTKATLRKEREGILTELHLIAKKSLGAAGANKIPVDMIVPLTKLARNYVLDGAITIAQVVDKIYTDLKEHLPGVEKDDIAEVIKDGFDRYLTEQNQVRLDRSKKIQAKKLEDLKAGIYEKKTYSKIQVDNDYLKIRAEINREQTLINKKIADIENSNKSIGRKAVDFAVKYGRQAKLASVTVLGKLAATGLTTITAKALTEAAGAVYSKVLPKIAAKSTVEGGINLSALAKSYARAATLGMEDSWKELNIKKGGQSDLSALYGKYLSTKLPAEAADFFGHLHSAIKAPVKRQAWEYSYAKRFAKSAEKGLDPLDPVVDATNRLNAYKDAERAIFMGDNLISKGYEAAMKTLENSNSGSAKNIAALTRILLPFVKVPTNIALSTGRYALGLIPGVHKVLQVGTSAALRMAGAETMAKVIHTGMGELTPEESDTVLRNLKHGSIGGAALLIGFYNPTNVGGFYQPGEHRKSKDANVGAFKLFGHKIPAFLTEHPIFQAMQIGSTYRRVLDAHRHKQDHKAAAALATASGLAEGIPLAKEAKQITDMFGSDTHKINSFISSAIKGEIEPAVVQQVAQVLDTKNGAAISFDGDNQVKRAPDKKHGLIKQLKQDLASGIPILRKTVPRKH